MRIVPRNHAEVVTLDRESAEALWNVHILLEGYSIRLLAEVATEEDVGAFTEFADRCHEPVEAGDLAATFEADSAFHLDIARRCGNRFVFELLHTLSPLIQFHGTLYRTNTREILPDSQRHYEIIAAIKNHDRDRSEDLLKKHVREDEHHRTRALRNTAP